MTEGDLKIEEELAQSAPSRQDLHGMHNVTRMDYSKAKGWWVRIIKDNTHYSKLFSDSRYRSSEHALVAAISYRNELLGELFGSRSAGKRRGKSKQRYNSGVIGVTHNMRLKNNEYLEESWVASWMENGRQCKKSFSVRKHGYDVAFQKSCDLRRQMAKKFSDEN